MSVAQDASSQNSSSSEWVGKAFHAVAGWLEQHVAPWVRYAYFLRFAAILWTIPLLLIWGNGPTRMRSLLSGIVAPSRGLQYLCVAFFLVSLSFVALMVARVVVRNGERRFGSRPPQALDWLLAKGGNTAEWCALGLSQVNTLIVYLYLYFNGRYERVDGGKLLEGLAFGTALAVLYWLVMSALYYMTWDSHYWTKRGQMTAQVLIFPRALPLSILSNRSERAVAILEHAVLPQYTLRRTGVARKEATGQVYEGIKFSLASALGLLLLFLSLGPLTAPIPMPFWSTISLSVYILGGVALVTWVLAAQAKPDRAVDRTELRWMQGILSIAIVIFALAIPLLYVRDDAERFPTLALVLILTMFLSWALAGIAFWADRYRIPVLTVFALAVVLPRLLGVFGGNEEHYLSVALRAQPAALPTPAQVLEIRQALHPGDPLIVVTSTGGGIHAAAWTTAVLAHLEREFAAQQGVGSFHDHLLLLSTVSGGSSGLYDYLRELDAKTNGGAPDWRRMERGARCSSLEAVGWGLVYYDVPKALIPAMLWMEPPSGGVNDLNGSALGKDRTWALRRAFARNLNDPFCRTATQGMPIDHAGVNTTFHQNEAQLAELTLSNLNPMQANFPAFTMNTTTVEGGDRFLSANYQIPRPAAGGLNPPPAWSFLQLYGTAQWGGAGQYADLPLATAAQMSATFPVVSSAARVPQANGVVGMHFVDGGYYDNDGTASAMEFLQAAMDELPAGSAPVRVLLVEIRNSPAESDGLPPTKTWTMLDELMAPLNAFMGAGHGSVTDRNRSQLQLLEETYAGRLQIVQHLVIDDQMAFDKDKTDPLNWALTRRQQIEVMQTADMPENLNKYCQARQWFTTTPLHCAQ